MCPGEPMDQSSVTLPTLAVSSNSDSSERAAHGERSDIINQAWFTTKEDKDSLQGKGVCIYSILISNTVTLGKLVIKCPQKPREDLWILPILSEASGDI